MSNVIDYYRYWTTEAIKADLDEKRNNFSVLCTNIQGDFNIGTVIRNANAFLAEQVIIYGRRQYDRRGAVGTHLYTNFKHVKEIDNLDEVLDGSIVIGIDNIDGAVPIESFEWPDEHFIMAFGEEQSGLPKKVLDKCDKVVYIRQYGSVRSLNVGVASGIAMYDYMAKKDNNGTKETGY